MNTVKGEGRAPATAWLKKDKPQPPTISKQGGPQLPPAPSIHHQGGPGWLVGYQEVGWKQSI